MGEKYHVYQFFPNGQYERVREFVDDVEAANAFKHYCTSVGARLGTTVRVIICDMGDCIVAEWEHGKGVIWPPAKETVN